MRELLIHFDQIIGIGVDTTGSTPIPVDDKCRPLSLNDRFKDNINAMVWLWKDHTSHEEAEEITKLAREERPEYLDRCGGTYSSEWWWSKILHLKRIDPEVFRAAHTYVEHCDYIPALLSGISDPSQIKRSICAAGHKAMYSDSWGGLPDREFLSLLDPDLCELLDRLYDRVYTSDQVAGKLSAEWSSKTGLTEGIPIAVGAFDCHMGAVACGVKEGVFTKILGTSTCDIAVMPDLKKLENIPGVCGVVNGSVLPKHYGIEAGSTGLLALDWNNGNRTILVDVRLSGILVGQTLHTKAHEIYRAYIEATAFGALTIINRIEQYGVPINEIVTTGGLAVKNHTLMQIYADVLNRPLKVALSDQTCAVGAAIFGASCGSNYKISDLQKNCSKVRERVFEPKLENVHVYKDLYKLYMHLHDSFGTDEWHGNLSNIMKKLIDIRDAQRA